MPDQEEKDQTPASSPKEDTETILENAYAQLKTAAATEALAKTFERLDALKVRLDAFRPLDPQQTENLRGLFAVDLTYNSNAIEGNTLDYQETKLVLQYGVTIKGKPLKEHLEVVNHKEALDYLEELVHKPPHQIVVEEIKRIHYLILKTIDSPNAGKWRDDPVYVRRRTGKTHQFCEPWEVPGRMEEFMAWLQTPSMEHPIQLAAEAHYRLVNIHPFADGNGRTSRLLMNLILMAHGFPPAVIKASDRDLYIDAIVAAQDTGNKAPFYRLVTDAVEASLKLYLETLEQKIHWR